MMPFHVGQKVVCVDVSERPHARPWAGQYRPVLGCVYTVRGWVQAIWDDDPPGIVLEEIINPTSPITGREPYFNPARFRPVKTTSIEIFQKMLVPSLREKVRAE